MEKNKAISRIAVLDCRRANFDLFKDLLGKYHFPKIEETVFGEFLASEQK